MNLSNYFRVTESKTFHLVKEITKIEKRKNNVFRQKQYIFFKKNCPNLILFDMTVVSKTCLIQQNCAVPEYVL